MKINPINSIVNRYEKVQAYSQKETPAYSAGTDRLELSEQARLFTEALAAAKSNREVNAANKQERIEQIKAQIENDTYEVDVAELCKKILLG